MKKSVMVTLILCFIASVSFAQMSDVAKKVVEKEKEMYESIKSGDLTQFKANLADNFLSVYAEGMFNRSQEIENIGNLTINAYKFSDVKTMELADGVVSMSYKLSSEGSWNGESFSGDYYASSIWVMKDGTWKAVFHTDISAASMEDEGESMDE